MDAGPTEDRRSCVRRICFRPLRPPTAQSARLPGALPCATTRTVALNRRARHEFTHRRDVRGGSRPDRHRDQVGPRRQGATSPNAYARIEKGEAWLIGADIAPFEQGNRYNHDPKRQASCCCIDVEIDESARSRPAEGPDHRAAPPLPEPGQGKDRARPRSRQAAARPASRHRRTRTRGATSRGRSPTRSAGR
jgi:hypothetical protein